MKKLKVRNLAGPSAAVSADVEAKTLDDLYDWQREAFDLIDKSPNGAIDAPTGAGKTLTQIALAAAHCARGGKSLIVTPQHEIAAGFSVPFEFTLKGVKHLWKPRVIDIHTTGKIQILKAFLKGRGAESMIVTQAALARLADCIAKDPKLLRNLFLCVDEAHHARDDIGEEGSFNRLGRIVRIALEKQEELNSRVLLVTATMFRGDQLPIVDDDTFRDRFEATRYTRTWAQHLKWAELKVHYHLHPYDGPEDGYVDQISKCFDDGAKLDKTVLFMPQTQTRLVNKAKDAHVARILTKVSGTGRTVLDGVTVSTQEIVKAKIFDARLNNKEVEDVILFMGLGQEGIDLPSTDRVIICGSRKSSVRIIQNAGRAFRKQKGKKDVHIHLIVPRRQSCDEDVNHEFNRYMKAVCHIMAGALLCDTSERIEPAEKAQYVREPLSPDELKTVEACFGDVLQADLRKVYPNLTDAQRSQKWQECNTETKKAFFGDDNMEAVRQMAVVQGVPSERIMRYTTDLLRRTCFTLFEVGARFYSDMTEMNLTKMLDGEFHGTPISAETVEKYLSQHDKDRATREQAISKLRAWFTPARGAAPAQIPSNRKSAPKHVRQLRAWWDRLTDTSNSWYMEGFKDDMRRLRAGIV